MRFASFIEALDMGRCEDQLQRQALLELIVLFVHIDGVVTEEETRFMHQWVADIPWSGEVDRDVYLSETEEKVENAILLGEVDDYIAHRARQLIDQSIKDQALELAEAISHADGELAEQEAKAIEQLRQLLVPAMP